MRTRLIAREYADTVVLASFYDEAPSPEDLQAVVTQKTHTNIDGHEVDILLSGEWLPLSPTRSIRLYTTMSD